MLYSLTTRTLLTVFQKGTSLKELKDIGKRKPKRPNDEGGREDTYAGRTSKTHKNSKEQNQSRSTVNGQRVFTGTNREGTFGKGHIKAFKKRQGAKPVKVDSQHTRDLHNKPAGKILSGKETQNTPSSKGKTIQSRQPTDKGSSQPANREGTFGKGNSKHPKQQGIKPPKKT